MAVAIVRDVVRQVLRLVFARPLSAPSETELKLIQDFRIGLIDALREESYIAESDWSQNAMRLYSLAMNKDPRAFLRWDVILRTMFVGSARFVGTELAYLKRRPDWDTRWQNAIQEVEMGRPYPYLLRLDSSGNRIHQAYHLARYEEETGIRVDELGFVLEFGGGYGCMCHLMHSLGFNGTYVILDLPPFSLLQDYYLRSLQLNVRTLHVNEPPKTGVYCLSNLANLEGMLESSQIDKKHALFIAAWSLSETPMIVRQSVMEKIDQFGSFLIGYQKGFGNVDNLKFFENWKVSRPDIQWHCVSIAHLPGHSYLLGASKAAGMLERVVQ